MPSGCIHRNQSAIHSVKLDTAISHVYKVYKLFHKHTFITVMY